jgi:hypothetical protein
MSRYATSDPTFISSISDKREAPSLVAPPAAKKKRTTKKVLIEVNILLSLSIRLILYSDNLILYNFRPEFNNHKPLQNLPMLHLLVRLLLPYFFPKTIFFIGIHLLLVVCRRNIGEPTYGESFSLACLRSKFTKGPTIFPSSRNFNFTKDSITPFSSRSSSFTGDESIFTSARSFKSTRDCTSFPSTRSFSFTRNFSNSYAADHPGNPS